MTSQKLAVSRSARGIASIVLSRPEKGNALDYDTIALFLAALGEIDADPAVRVVILRGEGKHFCSGADVSADMSGDTPATRDGDATIDRLCERLNTLTKPTIAVVHGACIGGGLALAACCDTVLATPDASFAIPEVRLGFAPAVLMPVFMAACGARFLRRHLFAGDKFGVDEARDAGLVHAVHAAADMEAAVSTLADSFIRAAPAAVANAKALLLRLSSGRGIDDDLHALHARWIASAEAREGIASFRQKRHPDWYLPGGT